MDAVPALVTDTKLSELVLPDQGAHCHPAVQAEPILRLRARTDEAWSNATSEQPASALRRRVALVTVGLLQPELTLARGVLHLRHCIEKREALVRAVHIGRRQQLAQRLALIV